MRSLIVLLFVLASACTNNVPDSTPAKVLENYIQLSFHVAKLDDKQKLEELLTGDTKNRLVSWSEDQFSKAFLETPRKFQGLKILETKKVSDEEVALTYELSFQEGTDEKAAQITQRKLCSIVKEGTGWKIKEVRSIRESIEYLKELSLP